MPRMVDFLVPQGMEPLDVAKAFTSYLIGPLAFENTCDASGDYRYGPFLKYQQRDSWQLDSSNDYWLHVEEGKARLACRYESQERIVELMFDLFKMRYAHRLVDVVAG